MSAKRNRGEATRANENRGETTHGVNGIRGETTRIRSIVDYICSVLLIDYCLFILFM